MITKEINWQGFNRAVVNRIDTDGMYVWDAQIVEQIEDKEVITKEEKNLGSDPNVAPFTLTESEILTLKAPQGIENFKE